MELLPGLIKAFLIGGAICALMQIVLEKTTLTAPKMLVGLVVLGAVLGIARVYAPFAEWAGAGATVPLLGFGAALAEGARKAVSAQGWMGIFTGALSATAAGIAAAVLFGWLAALLFNPKTKP